MLRYTEQLNSGLMRIASLISGILFFISLCQHLHALPNDSLTLDDLENQSGVHFKLAALGGHSEYCIGIVLTNNTDDSIGVFIEPGRVLLAENADFQDLVVMRSLYFKVPRRTEVKKSIYAFCCRAKRASPAKDLVFRNGFIDLGLLGMLGDFVDKGRFSPTDIQSSVWAISDNYPIASVCDNSGSISTLKKWLADQLKKPYPWHCIEYDRADTAVQQTRHLRVFGNFSFHVPHYSTINIQVRTREGHIVDYIQKDAVYSAGKIDYPVDFSVQNWPKGIYEILVFADGNRINKPTFFDL